MVQQMHWHDLVTTKRFRGRQSLAAVDHTEDVRSAFVKDADRVIYSSAFRRLQDKTQAHPFPETDYTRTRLTHSLEVASVGRSLGLVAGRYVINKIQEQNKKKPSNDITQWLSKFDRSDFGAIVAAACLSHDIGNPPFGHAGEYAIRDWFANDPGAALLSGEALSEQEKADLEHFEGNAQGFRILTRLQGWRENGGLQLTCSTLGAFMKYPMGSCKYSDEIDTKIPREKFGYFQHDREAFATVADTLKGTSKNPYPQS